MADYKVLITTSGTGSRLGELTKYTNKSLVRVGDKPTIAHIIDQYSKDTEFVVTLGYYGSHVKQFLELCYPDRSFTFVEVDHYTGPKSSLLYSISLCESVLQKPFVFHACDTVLGPEYHKNLTLTSNWIVGCVSEASHHYRTFNVHLDKIVTINEKGEQNYNFAYVGVAGIYDYKEFWNATREILQQPSNELSDCHTINKMIEKGFKFSCNQIKSWLDVGNVDSLKIARTKIPSSFHVLDKDDENIFIFDGYVYKFFHDEKICSNRVARFEHLKDMVPKLVAHTTNFYKYEYVEGDLLADCVNISKFKELLKWANTNLWIEKPNANHKSNCLAFYKQKTFDRVNRFLKKYNIKDAENTINGFKVPSMVDLLSMVDFDSLSGKQSTGYHGDFILDNVLMTSQGIKLIDWRQDFNGDIKHGDMFYDLAKLNHNLIVNHGMIKDNQFKIDFCGNETVECDINVKKSLIDCRQVIIDFCGQKNIDYKNIDILTSIIWINMAPLHEHPLDIFLYYFGKYNLFLKLQ